MLDMERIDREICGKIWVETILFELMETMTAPGHRYAGSDAERIARERVAERWSAWGVQTREQPVTGAGWIRGGTKLVLETGGESIPLPALAMNFSAATEGFTEPLPIVDLWSATVSDFDRMKDKIAGGVVLSSCTRYHGPGAAPVKSKYSTAVEFGAAAYISGPTDPMAPVSANAASWSEENPIPAVSTSGAAVRLIRNAMRKGNAALRILVHGKTENFHSANLIGYIPGKRATGEIILGAHFDSHDICPGAADNAAGAAIVSELARLFAPYSGRMERPIRFVLFTGEELGLQGSGRYSAEEIRNPDDIFLYYNFDLPVFGGFPALYTMTGNEYPEYWMRLGDALHYPFPIYSVLSRKSDHYSFYRRGIPCIWQIAVNRGKRGPTGYDHTAGDTLDKINPTELREAAMFAARMVLRLANEKDDLFRHFEPIPEDSGKFDDT